MILWFHRWSFLSDLYKSSFQKQCMHIKNHFALGPVLGSVLYSLGGFPLPFLSVGIFGLIISVGLILVVPDVQSDEGDSTDNKGQVLTIISIIKVIFRIACWWAQKIITNIIIYIEYIIILIFLAFANYSLRQYFYRAWTFSLAIVVLVSLIQCLNPFWNEVPEPLK